MHREEAEMFFCDEIATQEIPVSMVLFGIEPPPKGKWDSEHQAPPILPQMETRCVFDVLDSNGCPVNALMVYLLTKNGYGTKPGESAPIRYRHGLEFGRQDSPEDIRLKVRAAVKSFEQWLQEHIPVCTLSKTGHCEC